MEKRDFAGVPVVAQWLTNLTRNHGVAGLIPGLAQWFGDLALPRAVVQVADVAQIPCLLWLWCRPMAIAPIRTLAWEAPFAVGVAQEMAKRQKKKKKKSVWEFPSWHSGKESN